MRYLLDTNTCIFAINERPAVLRQLAQRDPTDLAVAIMTVAELWFGARKSKRSARARAIADAFLAPLPIIGFDEKAADAYANARFELERRGTQIGERDLIIASVGLAHGLVVVTNNMREFGRVPGLEVEDWTTG